jgi:hypothetical protein
LIGTCSTWGVGSSSVHRARVLGGAGLDDRLRGRPTNRAVGADGGRSSAIAGTGGRPRSGRPADRLALRRRVRVTTVGFSRLGLGLRLGSAAGVRRLATLARRASPWRSGSRRRSGSTTSDG